MLETGEGVGVEHFRPLVAVVAGGITRRATEEVAEIEDIALGLGLVFGAVAGEHVFHKAVEVLLGGLRPVDVELQVYLAEGELAHIGAGFHVVARGQHLVEEFCGDRLVSFVVAGEKIQALALPAPVFHDL